MTRGRFALLVGALVDLGRFWPRLAAFGIVIAVGAVLGRLVGGLLFRASPGGPPDHPPRLTRRG